MATGCSKRHFTLLAGLALVAAFAPLLAVAAQKKPPEIPDCIVKPLEELPVQTLKRIKPDPSTLVLLEAEMMEVRDASGHIPAKDIALKNAEIVEDPCGMEVIRFGEEPGSITIPDKGRFAFRDGVTVEAWVYLEEPIGEEPTSLATKAGKDWDRSTFGLSLCKGNRLTLNYVGLVGETPDYTQEEGIHVWKITVKGRHYPGRCNTMNGLSVFPARKWTHVAFTYDRPRHLLRTWVDFGLDREAFNSWREVATELADDDDAPLTFFKGATNLRVAQVHVASGAKKIGYAPPVRVYATELAYRSFSYIHVVQTSDDLPLPCEIAVGNISTPSMNKVNRYIINDREPHNFLIPRHIYNNVTSELVVRFLHEGREFYRYETLLCNPAAGSPASWRFLRGNPWVNGPQHPDWWVGEDNVIRYREKPVFPLATSHVRTNGFDLVTDLGFTMVGLKKDTLKVPAWEWREAVAPYFDKANERGVAITVGSCEDGRPAQGMLYAFDEPWGYSFAPMLQRYRSLRAARERPAELPVVGAQNNWQRYRETGTCTDIFAIDPYARGSVPLRFVYDATRAAVRETDGLKAIETMIGNYGTVDQRPDFDELRTMCYLAVAGGANMLGFYSWDDSDAPGGACDTALMPGIVENYRRLLAELHSLEWALTVPNAKEGPTIEPASPRGFFACAKVERPGKGSQNRTCLIVASDLYRTTTRTVVYPPAAGKKAALLYGPGREGTISRELAFDADGRAEISIPPLSTLVFVCQENP